MRVKIGRRISAFALGVLLTLAAVLGYTGGVSEVRAAASYNITYNIGTANVGNATIEYTFLDSSNSQVDNGVVNIGTGTATQTKSGTLKDNVAKVTIKVETAGQQLTSDSSITIGGTAQSIGSDLTGSGQTFNITSEQALAVNLTLESSGGGGGGSDPDPGSGGSGDSNVEMTLTVSSGWEYVREITYNAGSEGWKRIEHTGDYVSSVSNVSITANSNEDIYIAPSDESTITKVTVDGVELTKQSDGRYKFTPTSDSHTIAVTGRAGTTSIIWGYASTVRDDMRVEHGKIELVSVDGNTDVSRWNTTDGDTYGIPGGILVGGSTQIVMKAIPDYGYQLKSLELNEATLVPQGNQSEFRFTIPEGTFHLKGIFTAAENTIANTSSLSAPSVDASAAMNTGTAKLTIAPADAQDVSSVVEAIDTVETVDLTLQNIVSKGNGDYWTNDVTDASGAVTVSFAMNAPDAGEEYAVVRDHNGEKTLLSASYSSGTLSFSTDKFSTYTIVTREATASSSTTTEEKTDAATTETAAETTSAATTTETAAEQPYNPLVEASSDPVALGSLYAGKAPALGTTMIHPASTVKVTGVTDITDKSALAALPAEVNLIWTKTRGLGIISEKTYSFDIAATGAGTIAFDVGTGSPSAAVISHYHNGAWTRQIVDVVNGQAIGYFASFSPLYITVYEGVTAEQLRAAGISVTEPGVAVVGATSPKTDGTPYGIILLAFALLLAASGYLGAILRDRSI